MSASVKLTVSSPITGNMLCDLIVEDDSLPAGDRQELADSIASVLRGFFEIKDNTDKG